jgi:hypothetical protein
MISKEEIEKQIKDNPSYLEYLTTCNASTNKDIIKLITELTIQNKISWNPDLQEQRELASLPEPYIPILLYAEYNNHDLKISYNKPNKIYSLTFSENDTEDLEDILTITSNQNHGTQYDNEQILSLIHNLYQIIIKPYQNEIQQNLIKESQKQLELKLSILDNIKEPL